MYVSMYIYFIIHTHTHTHTHTHVCVYVCILIIRVKKWCDERRTSALAPFLPTQTTTTEYSFAMEANEPITRNRTAAFEERLSRLSRLLQGLSLCKQCPRRRTLQRPALDRYRIALLIGVEYYRMAHRIKKRNFLYATHDGIIN